MVLPRSPLAIHCCGELRRVLRDVLWDMAQPIPGPGQPTPELDKDSSLCSSGAPGAAEELKAPGAAFGVPEDVLTPGALPQGTGAGVDGEPVPSAQASPCSLVGPGDSEQREGFGALRGGFAVLPQRRGTGPRGTDNSAHPSKFDQRRADAYQGRGGAGHPMQAGSSGNGCVSPPATSTQATSMPG